tara:strand:+ start:1898 stop:3406 length:1509 start_codon:yes stop_codon:yes gene_type:complete
MFLETWRQHWGLKDAPFVHEDADKDPVLDRMESMAVHSSFDRLFGEPASPVPGVVFGEKGSGKSGLRLAMLRALQRHNTENLSSRAFVVQYIDFDPMLENLRRTEGIDASHKRAAEKVLDKLTRADHLDAILGLATTQITNELMLDRALGKKLDRRRRRDALHLAALYHRSEDQTREEAVNALRKQLGGSSGLWLRRALLFTLTVLALAVALAPHLGFLGAPFEGIEGESNGNWYMAGGALLAVTWMGAGIMKLMLRVTAARATHSIRVTRGDSKVLAANLDASGRAARRELPLPQSRGDEEVRYRLLRRLLGVLKGMGYTSLFVLVDRVDESALLAGDADAMQAFIEPLLQHKLLQLEDVALKMFLPIELSRLSLGARPDDLKRMRLDKANVVEELRWSGQELLEIANQRIRASSTNAQAPRLSDFLASDLDENDLRNAFQELGTPRVCFGFLGALLAEHARELPEDLDSEDSAWKIPRARFEVQRAAWTDRARVLRRNLN